MTCSLPADLTGATNSARRPQAVPECAGARVVYLASAGKPMRLAPYRGFPRPGAVVGDQIDGLLSWRLGYVFLDYRPPPGEIPAGPRLLGLLGRLIRPVASGFCRARRRAAASAERILVAAARPRDGEQVSDPPAGKRDRGSARRGVAGVTPLADGGSQ